MKRRNIYLVVDECFLDFVSEPEVHTLKGELEGKQYLFLLKAFTKRYAMAGLRLGYGITSSETLMEKMEATAAAVECVDAGAGSGGCGVKRNRVCRKSKRTDLSGTGISERRAEKRVDIRCWTPRQIMCSLRESRICMKNFWKKA